MSLPPLSEHSFDSSSFVCRFPGIFITLKGKLPPELIDTQVPLEVSVSLPEPYRSFLQPVVKPLSNSSTPRDFMQSEEREEKADENEDGYIVPAKNSFLYPQAPDPPCLALPPTFNRHASDSWSMLYTRIGVWMEQSVTHGDASGDWNWGREAYWMSFAAAFPHFPSGDWPNWNSTIELDGPFIMEWMGRKGGMENGSQAREDIWHRFCLHIWSRYSVCL
ncbi:protein kinase [Marasmius sp. AFHP31]|nr:protein kinase [Marasmius sp. AFHP31]